MFQSKFPLYMEPSDFNYQGLKNQRDNGAYDNFLRSNIDNEQDRRNFDTEAGEDHLPFRSFETSATDIGQRTVQTKMTPASAEATGLTEAGDYIMAVPGEPYTVPLRWNNPHSSELEVNIWVFTQATGPYVVPILKPQCSGEGYQDNVFTFTVPADFNSKAACTKVGDCTLQVYAHSVESRMYASGTPIIVAGGTPGLWQPGTIQPAQEDVAFDLHRLRRLCLPTNDPNDEADHKTTVVYEARLSSDVYNHAYQNSDFSPYAGQQPLAISQNLQASCILKMTANNFGELGKEYMKKTANDARNYANKLDKKARNLVRQYESITNSIIEVIKDDVANTATLKTAPAPAGTTECTVWRDRYDRVAGGRERGVDREGGYCPTGTTCLCERDCYISGSETKDGYCAQLQETTEGRQEVVKGTEVDRMYYSAQKLETCFRCAEVGSIKTKRQNTNTYIPSFEIYGQANVESALLYVAPIYLQHGFLTNPDTGLISEKGDNSAVLQIYMAVLSEMWEEFQYASNGTYLQMYYPRTYNKLAEPKEESLEAYKFTYRGPVYKTTTTTLSDANGGVDRQYRKRDENNNDDNGYYSAAKAWPLQNRDTGSSTAVPLDRDGPLQSTIPEYTANAEGEKSGGGATVYMFPPNEAPADSCSAAPAGSKVVGEITEEGEDMDGLNRDADCDDDAEIARQQAQHLEDCATQQEADPAYVCPDFEVECYIEGQDDQLPTQMFTNADGSRVGAASSNLPSFSVLLVAVGALFFL